MIQNLEDQISSALKNNKAQYVEIRIESTSSTSLRYRGRKLDEINKASRLGGCVRALAGADGDSQVSIT